MEIHKGDAIAALGTVIGADEDKVQIHIHGMEIRPSETGNILVVPQQILKLLERSSVQGDEVILKDGREGVFYSALNENVVIVLLHGHNEKDPDSYVNVDHNYIRCKNQDGAYKFVPAKREMPGSELVEDILKQFEQSKQVLTDQTGNEKASEADLESNSDENTKDSEPATGIARITAHEGMVIPSDYIRTEAPIEDAITVEMPQDSENFIIRSSAVTEQYSEDSGEDDEQVNESVEIEFEPESPGPQVEEDVTSEADISDPSQIEEEATESDLSAIEQEVTPAENANHEEEIPQAVEEKAEEQPEDPERIAKLAAMKKGILQGIQQIETEENPDSVENPINEDEDILASIQKLG